MAQTAARQERYLACVYKQDLQTLQKRSTWGGAVSMVPLTALRVLYIHGRAEEMVDKFSRLDVEKGNLDEFFGFVRTCGEVSQGFVL